MKCKRCGAVHRVVEPGFLRLSRCKSCGKFVKWKYLTELPDAGKSVKKGIYLMCMCCGYGKRHDWCSDKVEVECPKCGSDNVWRDDNIGGWMRAGERHWYDSDDDDMNWVSADDFFNRFGSVFYFSKFDKNGCPESPVKISVEKALESATILRHTLHDPKLQVHAQLVYDFCRQIRALFKIMIKNWEEENKRNE